MNSLSSHPIDGAQCPISSHRAGEVAQPHSGQVQQPMQETADMDGHRLTDDEREAAIKRAGRAMEKHIATWQREGCFAALGDAHRARRLMELLIAGRSPEQVARMAAAQAQRMTLEPGAERA